jgi:diguanylate cyclase (GGDEF)-like protein/PAS domain S-box-containing protein
MFESLSLSLRRLLLRFERSIPRSAAQAPEIRADERGEPPSPNRIPVEPAPTAAPEPMSDLAAERAEPVSPQIVAAPAVNEPEPAIAPEPAPELTARLHTLEILLDALPDLVYLHDRDLHYLYANAPGRRVLGLDDKSLNGRRWRELDPPAELLKPLEARIREVLASGAPTMHSAVWPTGGGHYEFAFAPVHDPAGTIQAVVVSGRDLGERQAAEQLAEDQRWRDPLTGLPNRVLARDRFRQALTLAARANTPVALLLLELDRFDRLIPPLESEQSDRLLQAIAARLRETLHDTDTLSRLDRAQFLILPAGLSHPATAGRIAQKLLAALERPFVLEGRELSVTASIGISLFPSDGHDCAALLRTAGAALRDARDSGRNLYRFRDERMNVEALERLLLEKRLRRALDGQEIDLHYQPLVELATGRIVGAEALLRWRNADLGSVAPAHFLPIAERNGLIVPIGIWVLETACRQVQDWQAAGLPELTMTVNISTVQFQRADFVGTVARVLRESGLDAGRLTLDLTESVLAQDRDNTLRTVQRLKAMGIRLAVDDFGAGYSSISDLKQLALDELKLAPRFIRDLGVSPDEAALARAIGQLGRSLRLTLLVEGVETAEQAALLGRGDYDLVQGYHFGKPVSGEDFARFFDPNGVPARAAEPTRPGPAS